MRYRVTATFRGEAWQGIPTASRTVAEMNASAYRQDREMQNVTVKEVCGRKAFGGMMPACTLPAGHDGDCADGFGGHYRQEKAEAVQPC